jgi:hypothetical protein
MAALVIESQRIPRLCRGVGFRRREFGAIEMSSRESFGDNPLAD